MRLPCVAAPARCTMADALKRAPSTVGAVRCVTSGLAEPLRQRNRKRPEEASGRFKSVRYVLDLLDGRQLPSVAAVAAEGPHFSDRHRARRAVDDAARG